MGVVLQVLNRRIIYTASVDIQGNRGIRSCR
jgi:hypothetical protein